MRQGSKTVPGLVFVAVLAVFASTAAAQTGQNFGELVGKVSDDQGAVLPGVTVTLTGPSIMGAQTAVTNDRGIYRFPGIPSGTYKLVFELGGFAKYERQDIIVPVRQTITVDAQLKLATLQESVTVTGASPTVDVENTKVSGRLDQNTLTSVPTSRSIFGATTVLPGMVMVRQDPGGLNAATSTGMVAHGASNYNLNYYGVTADTPQDYGSMYYMDYASAEEISIDTAAMGAEIGGGGGANINVIPKTGGNTLKGSALVIATGRGYSSAFSASNVTERRKLEGIREPALQKQNDFNANAGGPFVKDRLWWFGSIRNYNTHENVVGFPIDFLSNLRNYTLSSQYQLNKNNKLSGFWTFNRKYQPHRGAGVSQPNPEGTINQKSPKNLFNGNWTSVMNQNTFLEVSSSYFHMHWPSDFADEFYALPENQRKSATFNITTGVYIAGAEPSGSRIRDAYRAQTNIGLTRYIDDFLGAAHQLKTGFENWYGWGSDVFDIYQDTRLRYTSNADGTNLQPSEIFLYNTPLTQETRMRNFAAFVQDRLTYARFTVNLGLRWSFFDGEIPEQEGGGGRWFPRVTYPKIDPGYSWNTLAPRTGLIWKLREAGTDVVKVAYSRYYDSMYTTEFNSVNPNGINTGGVATHQWFGDANNNGVVDPGEYNPEAKSVFKPRDNRIDPKLKDPRTDEFLLSYQRELMTNVSFSSSWIQRWFNDQTLDVNIGIPTSEYVARVFTDPGPDNLANSGDERQVTFYDVNRNSPFFGKDVFLHTNFAGTQRYRGFEVALNKRMSDRWQMMASYVWSRLEGDRVLDPTNPNNLVDSMKTGRGSNDQPHAFKLLGSYQAPWGVNVGANYQALSGLPRDRSLSVGLSQGTSTYQVEPRGTYRADFLNLLSIRGDKSFRFGTRRVAFIAEVHNVLNTDAGQSSFGSLTRSFASQAAFDAARTTTSYFGRHQEIVAPRILKLAFKVDF